ncbi:molybdopterin-dependent oxidoreductase [Aeromicrobium sp. 9AM]|uniref:molybdopterin-dependent oxidoreductase n=1 Tax=Aeromicrobium sp. 9AM TaxID=2653126 RepID=UPI0012F049F2|nr:molybdopterin-dependent oxidoreductase [Aeromicrobium sp. 9AM]VXB59301.1 Oxidoreductase [Aeromicrobium sp. 9AM]
MTTRRSILSGLLAATAAIAASEGLAALFNLRESPVLAVGQSVIKLTPGPIAERIISVVGHADKPLAVSSVVVAILLLGALVGLWWPRPRAYAVVGALVVLASAAVLARPHGDSGGVLASVAAGAVVIGVLHLLRQQPQHTVDESRRTFLRTSAVIAVAAIIVGSAGEVLASRHRRRQALERIRAALKVPASRVPAPEGADLAVEGQGGWLTSNRDFYRIDTALSPPLVNPEGWTLRIHGMVDKELTLTYQDLLDRGLEHEWITICCVSNPVGGDLIGNTVWGGVPIKGILDEVGIQAGADALLSTSDDGWTCGTPLEALTDGRNALLALTMNGEPLPIPHGFPVRQVVPGLYGYVSATKWVVDWEVTRFADFKAYWTQRGWGERGPVKTESRIDVPKGGESLDAGRTTIAGVAWAQHVGIDGVEVRVDGGEWQKATLGTVPNVDTWVQWRLEWSAESGDHTIEARATNVKGEPQTDEKADVLPDGATGYPKISVKVK